MTAPRPSPNRQLLLGVAEAVRPILEELTFVGGNVAQLLITDPLSTRVRQTEDVDVIVAVTTRSEYRRMEERLRSLGPRHDTSEGAPICRWLTPDGCRLDVMPVEGELLQFSNRWYPEAIATAHRVELESGLTIRVASASAFLATKPSSRRSRVHLLRSSPGLRRQSASC